MERQKVFITGMGGYLAGVLCRELERLDWVESIHGMDVKKPLYKFRRAEFRTMDINSPDLVSWVRELRPDVFIHLAFIVDPVPDEDLMRRVNVEGTRNALAAAEASGAAKVMVASSGTAYGVWPDNPVPLKETDAIRAHPTFRYANDKSQVESLCAEWGKAHPDVIMSVIRPCVVYGPLVNNYLSNLFNMAVVTVLKDYNPPLQFVHEDDVAGAIVAILEKEGKGAFNVAPSDYVTVRESVEISGKPSIFLPEWVIEPLVKLSWKLQLPILKAPPSFLDFMRYPWVMSNERLTGELGYEFRYSTRETLEIMLRAKGIIE